MRTMLVWVSRMVTEASCSLAVTVASMKMRLLIPAISTRTIPAVTISLAWRACSGVMPSRHSRPLSGSAPTAPRAAAWALPTSLLPGMPQVKAFLNIPLFSRNVIRRIAAAGVPPGTGHRKGNGSRLGDAQRRLHVLPDQLGQFVHGHAPFASPSHKRTPARRAPAGVNQGN